MEKIAIITFHCSYNYGSALQAYSSKALLESWNYEVSIIDFVDKDDFDQYRLFRTGAYSKHPQSFIADILFFFKNEKRKINFENFAKKYFNLTDKRYYTNDSLRELSSKFDIFICGSDQIWNLDCTQGVEPAYFLNFADKDKLKIAYAPSLAHTHFAKDYTDDLKHAIKDVDYISVREKSTLPLIQPLTDKKISVVLDPTLLLKKADFAKILHNESKDKQKYAFVYMLEYNRKLVEYCNEFSRKNKLKLFYITNKKINGLKGTSLFGISPDDFLKYINNADCVITNSFHATVFSIIFNKQFCTFTTQNSSSRMVDLLDNLNLKDRIYKENFAMYNAIDYDLVEEKLNALRQDSLRYLDKALKRE